MRYVVTGGAGFVGSYLVKLLIKEGHEVTVIDNLHKAKKENLETVLSKIKFEEGDIRDVELIHKVSKNIDVIFNLAALIAIPYSYEAPRSYIETNVTGTLNVLQATIKNSVSKLISTSTSEVYGTARYTPIDEKHIDK